MRRRPIVIDLFAGAGGLSKGLEMAGFSVKLAVDLDVNSAATYRYNHPRTKFIESDIKGVFGEQLLEAVGICRGEVDLLAGGPPCQGFSLSNTKTRNMSNPNNHLVFEFIKRSNEINPKWILMENVAGLNNFENGTVRDEIEGFE